MCKQNHCVDISHPRVGKVFVAGVQGQCLIEVVIIYHVMERDFLHSQGNYSRTHEGHS